MLLFQVKVLSVTSWLQTVFVTLCTLQGIMHQNAVSANQTVSSSITRQVTQEQQQTPRPRKHIGKKNINTEKSYYDWLNGI